jgi:hypothetical protein
MNLANCNSTLIEHTTHTHIIKGLNLAAGIRKEKMAKSKFF